MSKNIKSIKKPRKKLILDLSDGSDIRNGSDVPDVPDVPDVLDGSDDSIVSNNSDNSDHEQIKTKTKNNKKKHKTEPDFDEKIEEIRQALKENYTQQKKLMNDLKELMTLHKKELKLTTKSGNRSNSGKHTGFNKPEPIPPSLKKLLKIKEEMIPRSKITALLYQYFTDNKMYNTKTKKEIIPNQKIREIFGMCDDDNITFYNLQTWLKKVYKENNVYKMEDQ